MGTLEDPFEPVTVETTQDEFARLTERPARLKQAAVMPDNGVMTATLKGFDLDDHPLLGGLPQLPGEIVPARTTVKLRREWAGASVVVLFEQGDPRKPIVIGVLLESAIETQPVEITPLTVAVDPDPARDNERLVLSAEREIVLRCGEASITLTRAGKVIIKGNYILSRSTGYNKIKGAAIDIN